MLPRLFSNSCTSLLMINVVAAGAAAGCGKHDRGDRFLMKSTRVHLQNLSVVAIGVFIVFPCIMFLCRHEAMADSTEYLSELQLLGFDEFYAAQVVNLSVRVTNRGSLSWPSVTSDPSHPVRMSYHWLD